MHLILDVFGHHYISKKVLSFVSHMEGFEQPLHLPCVYYCIILLYLVSRTVGISDNIISLLSTLPISRLETFSFIFFLLDHFLFIFFYSLNLLPSIYYEEPFSSDFYSVQLQYFNTFFEYSITLSFSLFQNKSLHLTPKYSIKGIILTLKFCFDVFNTDSKIMSQGV